MGYGIFKTPDCGTRVVTEAPTEEALSKNAAAFLGRLYEIRGALSFKEARAWACPRGCR